MYAIVINPDGTSTGSATLRLYAAPDVTGTLTAGAAVTTTITAPGQYGRFTFSGTAGQQVSLQLTNVTLGSSATFSSYVSIKKPDGGTLVFSTGFGTSGKVLDAVTLPASGTYTIVIDPQEANTGSVTLTLLHAPDVTGSITIGGAPLAVTTTVPGQFAKVTFSGSATQAISLQLTNVTLGAHATNVATVAIKKPDGSTLVFATAFGTNGKTITTTLPVAGIYTIEINPNEANTGSVTLTFQ
jgi:hypothetical protein